MEKISKVIDLTKSEEEVWEQIYKISKEMRKKSLFKRVKDWFKVW